MALLITTEGTLMQPRMLFNRLEKQPRFGLTAIYEVLSISRPLSQDPLISPSRPNPKLRLRIPPSNHCHQFISNIVEQKYSHREFEQRLTIYRNGSRRRLFQRPPRDGRHLGNSVPVQFSINIFLHVEEHSTKEANLLFFDFFFKTTQLAPLRQK